MTHLDMGPFEKYPELMQMDSVHHDDYMRKLQRMLDEIDGLPMLRQMSRMHDFALGDAAMICLRIADAAHEMYWKLKNEQSAAIAVGDQHAAEKFTLMMALCESRRDAAIACKDAIRAHMHIPFEHPRQLSLGERTRHEEEIH
jgi:hypothetical protein